MRRSVRGPRGRPFAFSWGGATTQPWDGKSLARRSLPARPLRTRFWAAVTAVVTAVTALSGCMADPLPWPTVRDFLLAWQSGHYRDAAAKTTGPQEEVATALRQAKVQLDARDLRLRVETIKAEGDYATATFEVRMWLDGVGRRWTYDGHMKLRRREGTWKVRWSTSVIHPELKENEKLAVVTDLPSRAPVLGSDGEHLVRATPVVTVGVQPSALADPQQTVAALAQATGADPGRMRSLIKHAEPDTFVPVATLRRSDYQEIEYEIDELPGLRLQSGTMPLPPASTYARALLGGVGPVTAGGRQQMDLAGQVGEPVKLSGLQLAFRQRLSGTPGTKVVALQAGGRQTTVLARMPGQESRAVHTTIDGDVQHAAEEALQGLENPAAFVAVQASTGQVLAVANSPASSMYNRAFMGTYRPGAVFTVVATEALLSSGLELSSAVTCPPKRIVGGETFRNRRDHVISETAGSFRESFAAACTTAFVGLSRKLPEGALRRAAETFGLGGGWELPLPAYTGSVPPPRDDASKAAAIIGEGGVRVSPLSMALVAGAVGSGTWHPPTLVTRPRQSSAETAHELPAGHAEELRRLMRATVESGTAQAVDLPGRKVYATTGTAGRPGRPPHAWVIGFRGDLAFAVLVENGGEGSETAAPAAAEFLRALSYRDAFEQPTQTRASP